MKLKGNSGLNLKMTGIVSAVIFGILFIIRMYHTFALIDGASGFFTAHNFTVAVMYALFGAGIILPVVLCYICKDLPSGDMKKKPSFIYVAATLLFALTLLYDAIVNIRTVLAFGGGILGAKEALGGNIGVISTVFGILGAVAMMLSVFVYMKKGTLTGKLSIPMLFPVIWAFLNTLEFFSVTVSYVKVSQLLFTIFYSAFLMVFLFENARVTTGVGRKDSVWFFYATGIITAAFSLTTGLPVFIAGFIAPDKVTSYCPFELYLLSGGIYALASMLVRARTEEPKDEISENVTETE